MGNIPIEADKEPANVFDIIQSVENELGFFITKGPGIPRMKLLKDREDSFDQMKEHKHIAEAGFYFVKSECTNTAIAQCFYCAGSIRFDSKEKFLDIWEIHETKFPLCPLIYLNNHMSLSKPKEESRQCTICLENEKNIMFLPCKHLFCCSSCASQLTECSICRKSFKAFVGVFNS